jgi:cation diffusion facilitator family transporter
LTYKIKSMNKKVSIARLSVASNTLLIILKLIIGILTGSVSIISEAIHSTMDLIAAVIAFLSVRVSDNPPDKGHPYGHGKIENISGVIEAILIFVAAIWIIYEAVKKIITPMPIESIGLGSAVMLVSAIVNTYVSRSLYKVARETDSVALEADALHLKTDVFTSLGVAVGLFLIMVTGLQLLDPMVAILVAVFILRESYHLLKRAFTPLLDSSLEEEEIEIIGKTLTELSLYAHEIRTRRSGNYRFVDMHLEMDPGKSLHEVHQVCDELENLLKSKIPHLDVNIHVEPFEPPAINNGS